jgi:hypothetical protein
MTDDDLLVVLGVLEDEVRVYAIASELEVPRSRSAGTSSGTSPSLPGVVGQGDPPERLRRSTSSCAKRANLSPRRDRSHTSKAFALVATRDAGSSLKMATRELAFGKPLGDTEKAEPAVWSRVVV